MPPVKNRNAPPHPNLFPSLSSTMLSVGIDMFATILVGTGLGWCSDMYWGIKPWGIIIGFILGATSGLLTTYRKLYKIGCGFPSKKRVQLQKKLPEKTGH